MKNKIFILMLLVIFFIGCAVAPKPRVIENSFMVESNYDYAWTAVIETFSDLQLPIQNMEKDSGLISTDWIAFTKEQGKEYCDCGKVEFGLLGRDRVGKFNVFVKKISENSCEMRVNCMFEQSVTKLDGTFYQRRSCISTGNLEKEINDIVISKLK